MSGSSTSTDPWMTRSNLLKPDQPQVAAVLKTAKEQLQEGMDAIAFQHKLIRLADSSECGWGAVDEYLKTSTRT